ncbi:hypothetical protein GGR49_002532 [Sphingomonas carotinifaciens]|nr:hypothetical protein [Sphingomonas carotinifaciens]
MADACDTHDYWQLSRLAGRHVESEVIDGAMPAVVAEGNLLMASLGHGRHRVRR